MKNISVILISSLIILIGGLIYFMINNSANNNVDGHSQNTDVIRYVAIGDSYTIGNGVAVDERWPSILTTHLNQESIGIQLVGIPAVSGYRVQDAIKYELPIIKKTKPDFVTVFIGANDSFNQISVNQYQSELNDLLDQIQSEISDPQQIVMITIPDYTVTPAARDYSQLELAAGQALIMEYNQVIKDIARQRGLAVADIFPTSQTMTEATDYISDGLHPSAAGYRKWESVILPVVQDKLNERK